MPLNAGAVTIAPDGTASGSGLALELWNAEDAAAGGRLSASLGSVVETTLEGAVRRFEEKRAEARARLTGEQLNAKLAELDAAQANAAADTRASLLAGRASVAARATAQAAAIVGHIAANLTVSTTVPSTPGTFVGVVT